MLFIRVFIASILLISLSACQTVKFGDLFNSTESTTSVHEQETAKEVPMQPHQLLAGLSIESKQEFSVDDEEKAQQALEKNYTNQPLQWQSEAGELQLVPIKTFEQGKGEFCREYQAKLITKGKELAITSIACRQENSAWLRQ